MLPGILLFALAFTLAFSPWFSSATDKYGKNHYFTKIEEVIGSRFSSQQEDGAQVIPTEPATETQAPSIEATPEPTTSGTAAEEELLRYELGEIDKAGLSGVFYHFFNNIYTGLAKLPTTLVLHPIEEQVNGRIWTFTEAQPSWRTSLRVENLVAITTQPRAGAHRRLAAWKRFGVAGLTGIIIQVGYYAGNAFSQTSGGRYLEPVFWILIVYYCLGIYTLTMLGIRAFTRNEEVAEQEGEYATVPEMIPQRKERKWVNPVLLAGFLLIGMVLPALDLIPAELPDETDPRSKRLLSMRLSQRGLVTEEQWNSFLQDPNRIIIQGSAYHPRYYRSDFYRPGNLSFELMLLSKDHVLVGYSPRMIPVRGVQRWQRRHPGRLQDQAGYAVGGQAGDR